MEKLREFDQKFPGIRKLVQTNDPDGNHDAVLTYDIKKAWFLKKKFTEEKLKEADAEIEAILEVLGKAKAESNDRIAELRKKLRKA
jgi:sulfur relay (sulfurtransferase) DsrF/TusC family protein